LSLYRLFATIDENKDGHLTHGEMTALVVGIQFEEIDLEHDDAVRRIMADFDTSRNQLIDEEEFVNGVCRWLQAARRSRAPAGDAGPHTVK
ncbi:sodium/calcium exchanger family protein, partial [Trifolium medium]|nr:sodium/calcium exchanger family protein [Trifolium medium]